MLRTDLAVEHAGRLDRAETHIRAALRHVALASRELDAETPSAAILFTATLRLADAVSRLA